MSDTASRIPVLWPGLVTLIGRVELVEDVAPRNVLEILGCTGVLIVLDDKKSGRILGAKVAHRQGYAVWPETLLSSSQRVSPGLNFWT